MKGAYAANAGTNTKPQKIFIRVVDMIDFLSKSKEFGALQPYSQTNNISFYYEFYTQEYKKLNEKQINEIRLANEKFKENLKGKKGIIALEIEAWNNAKGHVTLWENDRFLDETDYLPYSGDWLTFTKKLYFWGITQ